MNERCASLTKAGGTRALVAASTRFVCLGPVSTSGSLINPNTATEQLERAGEGSTS